jgi:hypothetical protein
MNLNVDPGVKMTTRNRIDVDSQKISPRTARRVDRCCSARQLCVRCSMMKIVQYRFKAFKLTFGRDPRPDEPLFFCAKTAHPHNAERAQVIKQLEQAADATRVRLAPVLEFLGLA